MVQANRRRPRPDHPLRHSRRLFLVLLFPRARLVSRRDACAEFHLRLCALPRQPRLVDRTRLCREPFPRPLRTIGSLSLSERRSLLLPRLSFRQSFRAVARLLLTRRMVWPHHLALVISPGRDVSPICSPLLPAGRRRRAASSVSPP